MTEKETPPPPPQIYLIMDLGASKDPLADLSLAVKTVAEAETKAISSLMIKRDDPNSLLNEKFISDIQAHNIAVVLEDNVPLTIALKADGVHLSDDDEDIFHATLEALNEDYIIGMTAKLSRHKAMIFAETGCSYMAINLDEHKKHARELEDYERPPEINWWVSLFGTPCVAWEITNLEDAERATIDGADFIALAPEYWQKGAGTENAIQDMIKIIKETERTIPDINS